MTNFTRELIYGKRPIHRSNPQPGQSEWYYLDPRGTDRFADMKEIDVESENSLNPYANEIQNYLYNNDKYNYKKLFRKCTVKFSKFCIFYPFTCR